MRVNWAGVFPALATPFASDGSVDKTALRSLIDLLLSEGVAGFVVGGSTGEYYSQTAKERVELFEFVAQHVAGRGTLVAGTSSISQSETLELTRVAKGLGYAGCMVLPPIYCLPTPSETLAYFTEVGEIGLPIMLYNNPARVGVSVSPGLAKSLSDIEMVCAYKESARDLYAVAETYYATRDVLSHFAGLEPYAGTLLSRGASGIVSTISNVCAREVVGLYDAFRRGDGQAMSRNQQVIDQLYHVMGRSGLSNFAFVKSAMAALGRPGGSTRKPHTMAGPAQIAKIRDEVLAVYAGAGLTLGETSSARAA